MKPQSTKDISWMMRGYIPAAALVAAMELGLFWLLDDRRIEVQEVAELLGIPFRRCYYWLEYLLELGLIEKNQDGYSPSPTAREAILESRSQETWALLAGEARERLPGLQTLHIILVKTLQCGRQSDFHPQIIWQIYAMILRTLSDSHACFTSCTRRRESSWLNY